jgi:hypothetical protein
MRWSPLFRFADTIIALAFLQKLISLSFWAILLAVLIGLIIPGLNQFFPIFFEIDFSMNIPLTKNQDATFDLKGTMGVSLWTIVWAEWSARLVFSSFCRELCCLRS